MALSPPPWHAIGLPLLLERRDLPDELVRAAGLPVGAGQGMFEAPTITCSHCQRVVVLNPLRTRDRGYCPKCDHYLCDSCEAVRVQTGTCRTFNQVITEAQEQASKNPDSLLVLA